MLHFDTDLDAALGVAAMKLARRHYADVDVCPRPMVLFNNHPGHVGARRIWTSDERVTRLHGTDVCPAHRV